jgi:hypothetical protein
VTCPFARVLGEWASIAAPSKTIAAPATLSELT